MEKPIQQKQKAGIVTSLNDTTLTKVTYGKYATRVPDEVAYEIYEWRRVFYWELNHIIKSGIRVKIQFLIGTGTVQGKASSTYLGQAQRIEKRHSVLRTGTAKGQLNVFTTGTAYREEAQRIADRHSVLRTGTAYLGQAQRI